MDFQRLALQYKQELLENVVPFWLNKSQDKEFGGYFSCLDREGNVFDTDKFIWLQAREVWLFSMLYNRVEQKQEWLECARQGGEFLKKYGHDGFGNWYFSLTREGKPLIQPYNIFSFTFAAMAFAQLGLATGNQEYTDLAKVTYDRILERQENPKGRYNKAYPGTRNLKNFALPMIMCNLNLEMEHILGTEYIKESASKLMDEVLNVFYRPEYGLVVENVNEDGSLSDTFDGRLLNPGHAIEAMWFIMDLAERMDKKDIIEQAQQITLQTLKHGWDEKYGGIFYFMDAKNRPPQQLEWDQKLWWVHIESLISLLKGYRLTGSKESLEWFEKVHQYTWAYFKDEQYPEWYGYLNRQGDVSLNLKGGKWKGCFHVPRGLYQCWQTLESIAK
ncbi:N-acylglucosamine 2-epimerase [Marinilabilia salmonicolor]|jgi:N-acylglucosamine 2-epimerase|uniref:AGE family epimerase/isomerase n=1 Tax=Marinilabilia salmonicolor TaxID=989 RepID=UPI000D05DD9D|nr:AGE family epimerase/isomerase [Marinilabilia salmonicolor]PRY99882.1 N-acylglucosamine 2-epimerase [Marinilabilia salmonicolor]